ncbi:hypothetical protein C8R46DRAFT_1215611 [Mycena filopes]|nr:hypothetical protein C8R46DRAFT_1215611 [Mycena filopes]
MAGPLPSLGEAHELRMAMVDSIFRKKPASKLENLPGDDRIQLPRLHQRVRPTMAYIARNAQILMVLDVPSPSFIPSLRNSFSHSPFYSDLLFKESPDGTVHSIFHLCGQDVLEDDRYLALMGKLPSTANHVISSPHYDCDSPTFEASAIHQLRMNRLDADMFPVPHSSPEPLKRLSDIPNLPLHSFPLEQGLDVYLQPDARPVRKDPSPSAASCLDRNLSPSILRTFGALKHKVMRQDARLQLREKQKLRPAAARERYRRLDDTAIIPLGAFGTHPSFSRNNPSILVRIPHRGSILLEACEGTLGQLIRTYGKSGADEILRDLRCIFVGENCAVNHGGLALLLARRWQTQLDPPAPNPVYLVAEYDVHLSLREISDIEDLGIDAAAGSGVLPILIDVIDSSLRMANKSRDTYEWAGTARSWTARKSLCTELGLLSFQAVRAPAPHSSYGLVFQHKDGWRIVYSGRNGLTRNLPETPAKTSTVLIHSVDALTESDTPDSLRHAVRELITKYQRIKPDHLLLTSFSGQFDRMALSNLFIRTRRNAKPLVSFAFDNARLTFGTMWRMNMYLPVLDQIWRQDGDEVDDASQSAQDRDA